MREQSFSDHPTRTRLVRDLVRYWCVKRRANNLPSMNNHALLAEGDRYYDRLGEINIPALVIHGTADRMVNYQHGVTLAEGIPDATLLTLEGTAHELHRNDWHTIIDAIIKHTRR